MATEELTKSAVHVGAQSRPHIKRRALELAMNMRIYICFATLLALSSIAHAADATNSWFSGMLDPPKVSPALPTNFVAASASPGTKGTKDFDMYDGVIWSQERTVRQFEFGADGKFSNAKDPLFYVVLSDQVGQQPGGDTFTNEKNIVANYSAAGLKKVKSAKTKWGDYPVLSLTGERPDDSPVFVAWVGINSPDAWTILIDYRVPRGEGHPTKEERKIWERFLSETKPQK